MFLTKDEIIARHVTEERLFELLKADDATITKMGVGRNSHGEFLFIQVKWERYPEFHDYCTGCGRYHVGPFPGVGFMGMGLNETEGRFMESEWRLMGATTYVIDTGVSVPLEEVLQEIEKRRPIKLPQSLPA